MAILITSLSDAVTLVRQLLNEATASFWSDTEIENWIKSAVVDITTKTLCYESNSTDLTLAVSTLEYAFSDLVKVYAAIYYTPSYAVAEGLQEIMPRHVAHATSNEAGPPKYFYQFNAKIGIWPLSSATVVSGTGKVTIFAALVSDDITNLPDDFKMHAIDYAVAYARLKERNNAEFVQLITKYLNSIAFARQDLIERESDSKDMMRIPDRTVTAG